MIITRIVARLFDLIYLVLIVDVLMSWIPNINREKEPFKTISIVSNAFFAPFRKVIPPIAMLDISPIAAFFCLSILRAVILGILVQIGV